MDAFDVTIWICVAVFAATASITILHVCGVPLHIPPPYINKLLQILLIEISMAGVGAFGHYIYKQARDTPRGGIPIDGLAVIEQDEPLEIFDGSKALYVHSPDVVLCRRDSPEVKCEQFALVQFARNREMTSPVEAKIKPKETQTIKLDGITYQVSYRLIGKLAPNPYEPRSSDKDFVLLHITH